MAEARMHFQSISDHGEPISPEYVDKARMMMKNTLWRDDVPMTTVAADLGVGLARYLRSTTKRVQQRIVGAVFPSTTFQWYGCVGVAAIGSRYSQGWLANEGEAILRRLPFYDWVPEGWPRQALGALTFGTGLWIGTIFGSRLCLKGLLTYNGYMYEAPYNVSYTTVAWMLLVKLFEGFGTPMTYSFQSVLPSLPVPSLRDTCRRYLTAARPLLDDAEYDRMSRLADDFQRGEGRQLQRWVWLKSLWSDNYVSDWWERFVYLRGRDSIMINSNYYITDAIRYKPTSVQVARAANLMYNMMLHRQELERQTLAPLLIRGAIPLCMRQYERTFSTCRLPGKDEDVIQHVESNHVAVLRKGSFYMFNMVDRKGIRLSAMDVEKQLLWIVEDAETKSPSYAEKSLPAMTGANRAEWAKFRDTFMADGVTRASLEAVERAVLFVVLDDSSLEDEGTTGEVCKRLLHGDGSNRWFDKSVSLVVFENGKAGVNCEHSWADAPVAAHLWEATLAREFSGPGYDVSGMNKAIPTRHKAELVQPLPLRWQLRGEAETVIIRQVSESHEMIEDLDLQLLVHTAYSSAFIKSCRCSPDAWVQMALQLAMYRDRGAFAQTYEASMTRLFLAGRTETVRPVTQESCAFAKAMCNPAASNDERKALLQAAVETHVVNFKDSMVGRGIDRHLFSLYVVSLWRGVNSQFLKEVLGAPWYLSTSQTPVQQTKLFDMKNNRDKVTAGGGFGPVTDDGYGVSYLFASDTVLTFHVSSKRASSETDGKRFVAHINQALADMHGLFASSAPASPSRGSMVQ